MFKCATKTLYLAVTGSRNSNFRKSLKACFSVDDKFLQTISNLNILVKHQTRLPKSIHYINTNIKKAIRAAMSVRDQ